MKNRAFTPHETLLNIVREKHEQIPAIMREEGIDCWIVYMRETAANPDPVQNLVIGGDVVWTAAFIFHTKADIFKKMVLLGIGDSDAERNKGIWDEVLTYTEGMSTALKELIEKLNPEKIALNYSLDDVTADGLSHGLYLDISRILDSSKFVSAEKIIQKIRSRKTPTEVELITNACIMADDINARMQNHFKPGMTEIEIQQLYYDEMDRLGVIESWERTGCPAVDAGPDKVIGHVGPSELKVQKGHTLHNDFGVQLEGYCSDLQRMWFFGKREEIPEELNHAFRAVHDAITKSAEFIKPGVEGWQVDKVARDHVISQGFKEFNHALGHQVGTKAHDGGGALLAPLWERYGDLPKIPVAEGNVFTLELHVVTENYGTVSLEEDILVTADGCRFLVPRQEDWICLE
ncbi:MAG: aminopeptidase P family protein [Candidatus Heimdallarchaeota archaeon]|nr:aminopeptidase P family protein [Candidatus Heimdallarchaeota archaeon]